MGYIVYGAFILFAVVGNVVNFYKIGKIETYYEKVYKE
jgi:hypothetical protein